MSVDGAKEAPPDDDDRQGEETWSLETLPADPGEGGLSLEDLSSAYAELLGKGHDPYEPIAPAEPAGEAQASLPHDQALLDRLAEEEVAAGADDACELSPRTLVEAILFVGHPHNEPMSAARLASLMRGVRSEEVEEIVRDLNETYRNEGCPYHIALEGAGYRMTLRDEFRTLRDKFYGRVKEARLSQGAVDVLAVVAYNQPVTRDDLDKLRDKDTGAILSQLVRRRLLQIERREEAPHVKYYRTTDRFLELFGLDSLNDLPRAQDLER
jgi:segregation and condensation protein B